VEAAAVDKLVAAAFADKLAAAAFADKLVAAAFADKLVAAALVVVCKLAELSDKFVVAVAAYRLVVMAVSRLGVQSAQKLDRSVAVAVDKRAVVLAVVADRQAVVLAAVEKLPVAYV
jgi:hypothetical protein